MAETINVPMSCEDFIALEFVRLVATINQTDPRSRDYAQLLENIERFSCAATQFPDIWKLFSKYYTEKGITFDDPPTADAGEEPEIIRPKFKKVEPEEPEAEPDTPEEPEAEPDTPEEPETEESYSEAEVKSAIAKARSSGKVNKISDWLKENWGVTGFPALPANKYGEVMKKLKELEVI